MPKGKVHGQGGHGRHGREVGRVYAHAEKIEEVIGRQQAKRGRKFNAQVQRAFEKITIEANEKITKTADRAKANLVNLVHRDGINVLEYSLRALAIDEYVFEKVRELILGDKLVGPFAGEIDFEQFRFLKDHEREVAFAMVLGKKPSLSKQRRIQRDIQKLKKKVEAWSRGIF